MGHILILARVFRSEILALQEIKAVVAPVSRVHYTDIPSRFTGIADWPKCSNLKCWHCSNISGGRPYFIPTDVTPTKAGPQCTPLGHFDSWACAARYAHDHMDSSQFHDVLNSIRLFQSCFTGERIGEHTHLAKNPQLLREFCGNSGMSHEEWSRPS